MSTVAARPASLLPARARTFGPPAFDYLVVGGGLSLAVVALVVWRGEGAWISPLSFAWIALFCNSAHFASSTVRLYTKPGARGEMPFLTMGLPLVALAVLTACIAWAGTLGPHLQSLYLTWSPYHYAAQAYGLALVYGYRSGVRPTGREKKLLWWAAMMPFLHAFLSGSGMGLDWLLPEAIASARPVTSALEVATPALALLTLAAPIGVLALTARGGRRPLPFICLLLLVANGAWWILLPPLQAFIWATIFHGLQYLAIVVVFHVKDQMARPDNRHGPIRHGLWFYGVSLLLGYALFNVLPRAYVFAGFGMVESLLLVVAAINVHHFIVDAFIWRLKKSDGNRRIVESTSAEAAAPA